MKKIGVTLATCLVLFGVQAMAATKKDNDEFRKCILEGKTWRECMEHLGIRQTVPSPAFKVFRENHPSLTSGYGVTAAPSRIR